MKAVIIEDETLIADEMKATIAGIAPDVDVIATLPSIAASVKWFNANQQPDFMFMDIKLSDGLSFELFEQIQVTCPIIFCTAYEEYAIRAFKVNGVDYLLKPVQEDDLEKAIEKIRQLRASKQIAPTDMHTLLEYFMQPGNQKKKYKERFMVNSHNKLTPVEAKDIAVIYREHLNYLFQFNGNKLIYDYSPLEEIEEVLDPDLFFRANRQAIVNINSVQSVKPFGNQKLMIQLKQPLKMEIDVSREKAPMFKKWLDR